MASLEKALYLRVNTASRLSENEKDSDRLIALLNYYFNLCELYSKKGHKTIISSALKKNYKSCVKKLEVYQRGFFDNFIINKDFHLDYFGEIVYSTSGELEDLEAESLSKVVFSENEFWDILRDFFRSINFQELFDKLYIDDRIHFGVSGTINGEILLNPLNGDTDIIINNNRKDLLSLTTLVHEVGHAIDFRSLVGNARAFNDYFYSSCYVEVISQLFEKLFLRFLSTHDKLKEKTKYFSNEFFSRYDILLMALICSVLGVKDFEGGCIKYGDKTLAKKLNGFFQDTDLFLKTLAHVKSRDINSIFNYAYGDIISTFLLDPFSEGGFSNDLVKYFMANRTSAFDENFLRECGFEPGKYVELYKKELQLVKK